MRTTARLALLTAATVSLGAMFRVGSRNQSAFLMVLFAGWILLPLVSLGLLDAGSQTSTNARRSLLHPFSIAVGVLSIAAYAYQVARPRSSTPAAPFLLIPLATWVGIAVLFFVTSRGPRKSD